MAEWYIVYNGQQVGPMEADKLAAYGLNSNSKVWKEGMADWVDAYTVPELMAVINNNSVSANGGYQQPVQPNPGMPKPQYNQYGQYISQSGKSKTTAGILAILLGAFGAQYFYLGKIGAGFVFMLIIWGVTIITCGIGAVISVVPLIQGILMLTMSDEEFDRKYVYSNSFMPLF